MFGAPREMWDRDAAADDRSLSPGGENRVLGFRGLRACYHRLLPPSPAPWGSRAPWPEEVREGRYVRSPVAACGAVSSWTVCGSPRALVVRRAKSVAASRKMAAAI